MEYIINVKWDSEVNKWIACNDTLPISAEAGSFKQLRDIVVGMAYEMVELNTLPKVETIRFWLEGAEEVVESKSLE